MTRSEIRAEERRWRRGDVFAVAGALLLGMVIAWIILSIQGMRTDLQQKGADVAALAQQVRDLGGKPVAGPRGEPGKTVVGPQGPKGDQGEPGSPGASGSPGKTGTPGKTGATGEPGAVGPTGPAGAVGPTGPQGPQGDTGPAGPAGPQGPQGPQGEQGPQGPAGPNCPDGYSPQAPTWDPNALVCEKDGTSQQPGNGSGGKPQAAALDPTRREQYI